ncbi:hypothetical protein N7466_001426 [Penicillium verhagenii]|uniref:uncharacterized protein n=1 Tax=Penicillium verhagenii TaxID=1562060 RepID=UPI00254513F5|nr:uncharacterized protein N7466_001426 [Penicillium verhagenii]KAJ5938292.1 hypothetical protein N7466_001426 [Penicillium verhagenii]
MQSTAFLARENELLGAGNEKIKRKEARSKLQIAHPEGLSVAELKELAKNARNDQIQPLIDQPTGQPGAQERRYRAPPKCSQCGIQGHKRTHCPDLARGLHKKAEVLLPTWGIVIHDVNVRSLGVNSGRLQSFSDLGFQRTLNRISHSSFRSLLGSYHHDNSVFLVWEHVEVSVVQVLASRLVITASEIIAIVKPISRVIYRITAKAVAN